MATKLYLNSETADAPVPNAKQSSDTINKDAATSYATYANPAKMTKIAGSNNRENYTNVAEVGATHFHHYGSWVSDPVSAQTISGTLTVALSMREGSGNANANPRILVYRWKADDTFGSYIVAATTSGIEIPNTTGYPTAPDTYFSSISVTSTAMSEGDRIVIEIETYDNNTRTTAYYQGIRFDGADAGSYGSYVTFNTTVNFPLSLISVAPAATTTVVGKLDPQPKLISVAPAATTTVTGKVDPQSGLRGTSIVISTIDGVLSSEKIQTLVGTSDVTTTITGILKPDIGLRGTSDSTSTVTGLLTLTHSFISTISSISSVIDTILDIQPKLIGSLIVNSTVIANMNPQSGFKGTSDTLSTAACELTTEEIFLATADAISSVTGLLSVDLKLTGTIDSTSSISGIVTTEEIITTYRIQRKILGGEWSDLVAANPDLDYEDHDVEAGTTYVYRVRRETTEPYTSSWSNEVTVQYAGPMALVGTVDVQSTVSAILSPTIGLFGTSTIESSVSAKLDTQPKLIATSDAVSIVNAIIKPDIGLFGSVTTQSTASVIAIYYEIFTGTVDAISTVSGTLSIYAQEEMYGTVDATTTVTSKLVLTISLVGSSIPVSTVSARLDAGSKLLGTIGATSTVDSILSPIRGLIGTITTQSIVDGILFVEEGGAEQPLYGTVDLTTSVTGILSPIYGLVATVTTQSSVSAVITIITRITTEVNATTTVSGTLSLDVGLESISDIVSTVTGLLSVEYKFIGSSDATSTVTGHLISEVIWYLSVSISAQSTVLGWLLEEWLEEVVGNSIITKTISSNSLITTTISTQSIITKQMNLISTISLTRVANSLITLIKAELSKLGD